MKIIGDIEINKATVSGIVIALVFISVVALIVSTYEVFLDEERRTYRAARRKRTIVELEGYLRAYPEGRFVGTVRNNLDGLYGNEYRKCLSYMVDQVKIILDITRDYQSVLVHAAVDRRDPSVAVDAVREELEIKGTFKALSEANTQIENYLHYGAYKDARYRLIHEAMLDVYHAYLKLYHLGIDPLDADRDYTEAVNNAHHTFLQLKMTANMMIVKLSTTLIKEETYRVLKAKGIKRPSIQPDGE